MNNVPEQPQKQKVSRPFAILSFITIIFLIAWLSIQLVHVVPGAFSSLASLAETMNQPQGETATSTPQELVPINITSEQTIVNAGEPTTISWGKPNMSGSFTFSYQCTKGVAVNLINIDGLRGIDCETNYNIGDVTSLTISVDSEKERYADLEYTISFLATNDTIPRASGSAQITIVNSDIQNVLTTDTNTDDTPSTEPASKTETVTKSATPANTGQPTYHQEFTYEIPASDPNGHTDLSVRFLNAGTIVGDTFFPGVITQNENGAIQLEVRNLGTKTSENWDLAMILPNGGTYNLTDQAPLKPSETATIVIGFPAGDKSTYTCDVTVDTPHDSAPLNNHFRQVLTFVK